MALPLQAKTVSGIMRYMNFERKIVGSGHVDDGVHFDL